MIKKLIMTCFIISLCQCTAYAHQPLVLAGEEDAVPDDVACYKMKFTNGDFTDNGDGTCSVNTAGAAGSGDAATVNSTAIDSTANFLDGDIDFSIVDGGPGGPDDITATVACAGCVDDADVDNDITIDLATTVTTNANLTGEVTSTGNATLIVESFLQENGASELRGEDQGTACAENQIWKADATGGMVCAADNGGAETNTLETLATGAATNEVFVGSGADAGTYITIAACAADEKIEYTDGAPNTFTCEAIGGLVDADISDTLTASDLVAGSEVVDDSEVVDTISITNISQVGDITATASEINTPLDGATVTLTEFEELALIGATTISAAQWTGLGGATTAGLALWDDAAASNQLVTLGLTATAAEINTPLDGATVTLTEFEELALIGATTISAAQWTGLGGATTAGIALWDDADNVAQLVTLGVTATAAEINTPLDGATVTLTEFEELAAIGATVISAADWTAVAALVGVNTGDSHTIASHSDTTATGLETETLTDGSDADALHVHSGASLNDDIFGLHAGDVWTGTHDFGGATDLEIINAAAPVVDTAGQVAMDTTITSHNGMLIYHDGTTAMTIPAIPTADLSVTDNHIIKYDLGGTKFTMEADADSGGSTAYQAIGDSVGSGSIAFDDTETATYTTAGDGDIFFNLASTAADLAGDTTMLHITAVDNDDVNYIPVLINDDSGGDNDIIFKVGSDGTTTIGEGTSGSIDFGTNTITDAIAGNLLTDWMTLPVQSAKLTGDYVTTAHTGVSAAVGAAIDAGQGAWRLLFDLTTEEAAVWGFRMPNTYASGLTAKLTYSMDTAVALEVEWEVSVMAITDGETTTVGFDTTNVGSVTVPGTVGLIDEVSITLTNADLVAAGDLVYIYISLDSDDATNDDAVGDRELLGVQLEWLR